MNKITIIRHSQLAPPFDNYENLSYEQIDGLALGTISPDISENSMDLIKSDRLLAYSYDLIIHSHSNRSFQTSKLIKKIRKIDVELFESKHIHEIVFSIKSLLSKAAYQRDGLQGIRNKLYKATGKSIPGVEQIDNIHSRIELFNKEIQSFPSNKNILVISHGFLMRYLKIYFDNNCSINQVELQYEAENMSGKFDYLNGFVINRRK